jgi:hypothetical protein
MGTNDLARAYGRKAVTDNFGPFYGQVIPGTRTEVYQGQRIVAGHVITSMWGGRADISGPSANIIPLLADANIQFPPGTAGVYAQMENELRGVFSNSCVACVIIEFEWSKRRPDASLKIPVRFRRDWYRQPNSGTTWVRNTNRAWVPIQW